MYELMVSVDGEEWRPGEGPLLTTKEELEETLFECACMGTVINQNYQGNIVILNVFRSDPQDGLPPEEARVRISFREV